MYFFYYIPVGLDIQVTKRVFVTRFFVAISLIIFIISKYVPYGGVWNPANLLFFPSNPSIASAVTHAFVHLGWMHIAGNMVYLVIFGRPLESKLGAGGFFAVFVLSAVAGAYTHLALARHFMPSLLVNPVGGASGATSGILGAFMIHFYYSRIKVAYWVFMPLQLINKAGKTAVPVVLAVMFWLLYQGVYALLQFGAGSAAVAYGVHIGGFICGMGVAVLFGGLRSARCERHLVKARRHFRRAEWFSSQGEYLSYLEDSSSDPAVQAEAARAFLCTGSRAEAAGHFASAVKLFKERGERDIAEETFVQAAKSIPLFRMEEKFYLDMAFSLERSLKFYSASKVYKKFIDIYPLSESVPLVLMRLAGIYKGRLEEPGKALEYYKRILKEYPGSEWTGFAGRELEKLCRGNLVSVLP
ncbi:MAG: rhomboid family intramembrane serine protease [Candidatus Krumholzibacteriota bacterium]|nr:rhomboid family intramembrane serine protease [Candidatus Krumholzibacteriota bacterium]